jgi:hypothetical protein
MPRYFFTIHGHEQIETNPAGAYLPDEGAVISCAEYIIGELKKKNGYEDDLSLLMIVRDEALATWRTAAYHSRER